MASTLADSFYQNQRLKRLSFQLTHDDDVDHNNELYRSDQESPTAHRLVDSLEGVRRRRINTLLDGGE
jgi:hypothetical protein